jgi:hypothetical protein
VKKIKGFKINLRSRDILRFLKNTANISEVTPQLEEAIKREKTKLEKTLKPAIVFETLTKDKVDFDLGLDMPPRWISASFCVATLGIEAEKNLQEAECSAEGLSGKIIHSIYLEALEQSVNFVSRIISDEAKQDNCELSERMKLSSYTALHRLFEIVTVDKIGVSLLDTKELQPQYTTCAVFFWIPNSKKKR